ncbi:MAG: DUF732 domain-containing protein [Actinoplanes sp.]
MTRIGALVLAGALLAGVAACSDAPAVRTLAPQASAEPAAPPEGRVAASPASPSPTGTSRRKAASPGRPEPGMGAFVAAVQEKLPLIALDRRDEEVAAIALAACGSLTAGKRPATVVGELNAVGIPDPDAGAFLTLARSSVCRG